MITLAEFKASLNQPTPPAEVSLLLQALWHEAKGDWDAAHKIAQNDDSQEAAWVHAYLHRKEGDLSNAQYWYRRASKTKPDLTLEDEWTQIANELLG